MSKSKTDRITMWPSKRHERVGWYDGGSITVGTLVYTIHRLQQRLKAAGGILEHDREIVWDNQMPEAKR